MKFRFSLSILCLLLAGISQAQIVSDFNANADGWQTSGQGGIVTWNPGGYITATDWNVPVGAGTVPVYWNFNAPAKFLGNISSYYNGNLTFDLQETVARTAVQQADVQLTSGTTTLYYFSIAPPYPATAPGWTSYTVPLSEATGNWKTANSATGPAATNADIKFVLANMIGLYIRGRFGLAPLTTGSIDNVRLTPFVITIQPTPQAVCDGTVAVLNTAATGNSATTFQWQIFNTAFGSWNNLTNVAPYSGVLTSSLNINTTGNKGAGTYRCQISGAGATNMWTNSAAVTINPNPPAPTTTGKSGCVPSSLILTAAGGSTGQYRWYTNASGGSPIAGQTAATYTTGSLSITTTYYVSINNGTCESARIPVTATLVPVPTAPTTTGASSCGPATLSVSASGGTPGQFRWYTVPTGGIAIAGQTNGTLSTGFISTSVTYYAALNNGTCESSRTPAAAQIFTPPAAPTPFGNAICGPGPVTLGADGANQGQYRWYTTASGGVASTQVNSTFVTPPLPSTTTFYVAVNNGVCEGARSAVVATIFTPPSAPGVTGASLCEPGIFVLHATGGIDGQYRWYAVQTGGTPITGETKGTFTTPLLSATMVYYVSVYDGNCEGARAACVAEIKLCDTPPSISTTASSTEIDGEVLISLLPLLSDQEDNIDLTSLKVVTQPASKAIAKILPDYTLSVDYKGLKFSGQDSLVIEVCDAAKLCTQQQIKIEVVGDIVIYNGVSANGDTKNDILFIKNIDALDITKNNHVSIYNRWGDVVFETDNYDNDSRVFSGLNKDGGELPPGTYFYKIDFGGAKKAKTGYISLKR